MLVVPVVIRVFFISTDYSTEKFLSLPIRSQKAAEDPIT